MSVYINEKFQRDDQVYLAKRKELPAKLGLPDLWPIVDHFGLYVGIQTLGIRLAVFEIMKKCLDVPGHIVEFGCWNGANLIYMAKVLQLLQPNTYKHIYGFDSFEGLQSFSNEDGNTYERVGRYCGNEEALRGMIDFFSMDEWFTLLKVTRWKQYRNLRRTTLTLCCLCLILILTFIAQAGLRLNL